MPRPTKKKNRLAEFLSKALGRVLLIVLVLICIGVFYVAVILAEIPADQQVPEATAAPSITLSPEQPWRIASLGDLTTLTANFPAPALVFQMGDALIFDEGLVNDLAYEGSFARMITLSYHTPAGEKLTLYSIYPADAFVLLPGSGYVLQDALTASLAGMTAVRMENGSEVRLHVRGESALYAMTAPLMGEEQLSLISRQALLLVP